MAEISIGKIESLNFYKYLCQKIGSEKVVRTRRLAFTIRDTGHSKITITSGSKGEGLNLNGSDFDMMVIDPQFKVYQSETEIQNPCFATPLIMNTEETQPCFTQLRLLNQSIMTIPNVLQENNRGCMLSSELYKLFYINLANINMPAFLFAKIHGPCISDKDDKIDFASCLKCDKWIFQAEPWISRPRTTWPSFEIISLIVSSGVLFVPIGRKGSINEHLEWRISFSVAEKFLIFSFSHTQLLCYALLKILLKEIVEKHEDLKGLLCSYFLKTLMFWISEETDPFVWRPDNLIPCFMACLQRLLYYVKYSILSHYFIPDNNLFYSRFNTYNEEQITTILTNFYEQGVDCFASSETLHDFQSQSYGSIESLIGQNSRFSQQVMPALCAIRKHDGADRVFRLLYHFLHSSRTDLSRGLFAVQISEASMLVPEETQYSNSSGNKNQYFKYKQDLSHLVIGLHSDAVSGLLMLASFFYVQKHYVASLTVIAYALPKCTEEKICCRKYNLMKTLNRIQKHELILMEKEKLYTLIQTLLIFPISFSVDSSMIPEELKLDVARKSKCFSALPFAHFLNFLCNYHLHDISSCRQSLERLKNVEWTLAKCRTFVFRPQSLNTVVFYGIGCQLIGKTHLARLVFQEAASLDKRDSTSAALRLCSLG